MNRLPLFALALLLRFPIAHGATTNDYTISIGDTVSNGVPTSGAGNIAEAGDKDLYHFTAEPGQRVYFEDLAATAAIDWRLTDTNQSQLFSDRLNGGDPGVRELTRGGAYTLHVQGVGTATGDYSFRLWDVPPPEQFAIAIGDTVENGAPGPGAGNIEAPGAEDVFTFTGTSNQLVYFEDLAAERCCINWEVYAPNGARMIADRLDGNDPGRRQLPMGGTYTIYVQAAGADTSWIGTYSFRIRPIPEDEMFTTAIGETVTNGVPAAGAGHLEVAGAYDIYTFTGTSNQLIYFEDLGAERCCINWDVYEPNGGRIVNDRLDGNDPGRRQLPRDGTYTIYVYPAGDDPSWIGTYSFHLRPIPPDDEFSIAIGDTVTNGVPAAGAGNLEMPGAYDIFTFTGASNQLVYFEDLGAERCCINWDVYEPNGGRIVNDRLDGNDPGRRQLPRDGTYTIYVYPAGDDPSWIGTYSLRLRPIPPDEIFAVAIGDTISDGVPEPGAGHLAEPGANDVYTFTGAADQVVFFEDLGAERCCLNWDVYPPSGNRMVNDRFDGVDPGVRTLPLDGTYTIYVYPAGADVDWIGPYSFRIWGALPVISAQPQDQRALIGESPLLSVQAVSPFMPLGYHWLFHGTNLPGATTPLLVLSNATPAQAGPYSVVVTNQYGAVTSAVATLTLDTSELFVTGFGPTGPQPASVSELRVQFNEAVNASSFTPGDVVVHTPSGTLASSAFTITPSDTRTFSISIPPQTAPGDYTVEIGPDITNQSGQPMSGGVFVPVYSADFESGAAAEWSHLDTLSNAVTTSFLGRYGNTTATLALADLPPHDRVRLVWDLLILDSWDGNQTPGPDYWGFKVEAQPLPVFEHTFLNNPAAPELQSFPGRPTVGISNFIGSSYADSIYRDLQLDFAHTSDQLSLDFYGRNLQSISDESWGLDNVRVFVTTPPNGLFTARFRIDGTAPTVAGQSPDGTSLDPVDHVDVTFSEVIQPASFTLADVQLTGPAGPILASSVQRLSGTVYRVAFPSQRVNSAYTLVIGPDILDLAGNAMSAAYSNQFNVLTPPLITTQPAAQTIVRNNEVAFSVVAQTTPPATYQWDFDGTPIANATNATLTLSNVQTNQSGAYRVTVTDSGGSTLSAPAVLTVNYSYGPFVFQSQAARTALPTVPGNGVFIELFNGIGGGPAPTPALISNVSPSGTTLSPVIDFPHPGATINVGNSFNNFFADTTTPPEQVLGLSAANFVLRIQFFLRVSRDLDLHPETTDIDLLLGVGSDDGFYLLTDTNFLGSAGDRGFRYSWLNVSFEDAGLYPVTLLFAANAVGFSGLELSWQTALSGGAQIIPQSALYITPDLADQLITFEEVPPGTVLTNQFQNLGVKFNTLSGAPAVTANFPTRFVPVSPTNVLADPRANPGEPGELELLFVAPDSELPATTAFLSFFVIDAETNGARVLAFAPLGSLIYSNEFHGGGGAQELVTINRPNIARVRITLGQNEDTAAIDNVAFLTPVSLPDLVVDDVTAPTNALAGQPVQIAWRVVNRGIAPAAGPWSDTISLSTDDLAGGDSPLLTLTYTNTLASGEFLTHTQTVILPAGLDGNRWIIVTTDSRDTVLEAGSQLNNAFIVPVPLRLRAPDLIVENVTAPNAAQFGQTVNITWSVRNQGSAPAGAGWSDRIYLAPNPLSVAGATLLATVPAPFALDPAAGYTNAHSVTLPLSASATPGNYHFVVLADATLAQPESNESNNLGSTNVAVTVPALPDLAITELVAPPSAQPGQTIFVSWTITNQGLATATAPWTDTIALSADAVIGNDQTIASFTITNSVPPGGWLAHTQQVAIPLTGASGSLRVVARTDAGNAIIENEEGNNAALSTNATVVPAALALYLPVSNVAENTSTPNLAGLVSRNGDLSGPAVIALTSSNTNKIAVPASVTIPANAPSAPFTATVLHDGVFGPDVPVMLSAASPGYLSATTQVVVVNTDSPSLALSFAASEVTEGQTFTGTVTRELAAAQPLVVELANSSPTRLALPPSVTIPADSNSVSFSALAVDNTILEPARTHVVTASAAGYATASANVTVLDNDLPQLTLSLARTNFSEGDGPLAVGATARRELATDRALVIALASSDPTAAVVPAQITIPAFQNETAFHIGAVDDALVDGPQTVQISAQALDVLGGRVGNPITAWLLVEDDDGPTLRVTIATKVVPEGLTNATEATVSRNTPPTNSLVVQLASSDLTEASVPSTVTIPFGETSASFTIASEEDGVADGNQTVTITASAADYTSGQDQLIVTDINLPDLIVASINVPPSALTEEPVSVSFRIANEGLAPLTNVIRQRIALSSDSFVGGDTLVGQVDFAGTLAPQQYFDQSFVLPASALRSPGNYWVVVTADADGNAVEVNEANNSLIRAAPLSVSAEYTAVVETEVTTVPAGTSIPLHGSATLTLGGPAVNKPVKIHLTVRGLTRALTAYTDTNGNFSTTFTPLPTEAGHYTVGAAHPGVTTPPIQDAFVILGMKLEPDELALRVIEAGTVSNSLVVENLSEVPLTGLTAAVEGLAANLSASATLDDTTLPGQGTLGLSVLVTANDATIRQSVFTVRVAGAEGVSLELPVTVTVEPLRARLVGVPAQLDAAMLRGQQTIVQFDVLNEGGAPSGPIVVNIPAVPWLSVASTNPMPSLAPGASNRVTLVLTPALDLALGPYSGSLVLNGSGVGLTVPFTFRAVSDGRGALRVRAVDEFTFFADGAPALSNAAITLIEPFTRAVVTNGVTDTDGLFLAAGLPEGTYELDVAADKHAPFRGTAIVSAAQTNAVEAFLSRQTVQYIWTVEPTEIEDLTRITIRAEFEVNVPAPVVVVDPPSLDLAPLQQPGDFMDIPLTLANHGLIAVHDVRINIGTHPLYQFDLLTRDVGTLAARSTVTVPLRITRVADPGGGARASAKNGTPCTIEMGIGYLYLCGKYDVNSGIAIPVFNVVGDCPPVRSGGGRIVLVGCDGCRGGPVVIPPGSSIKGDCDQCMAKALLECAIGFTPAGCPYGVWSCVANAIAQGVNASTVENCIAQAVGCTGPWGTAASCLWSFLRCKCPGDLGTVPGCIQRALGGGGRAKDASVGLGLSPFDARDVYAARSYYGLRFIQELLGDSEGLWFSEGSGGAFGAWFDGFNQAIQPGSPMAALISPDENETLLNLPRPDGISAAHVQATVERWNRTIQNWRDGIYSPANVPNGGNPDFIDLFALSDLMVTVGEMYRESQEAGFDSPAAGFLAAIEDAESKLGGGGVCARVVLQIDQDAVQTRDAFRATLEMSNSSSDPLLNLSVDLMVRNQAGEDVSALFGIRAPTLSGDLAAVDGSGMLLPNTSGRAQWILIPTQDAAPVAATDYLVSGTLRYTQNGANITIPLAPAPIHVLPNPRLFVKYFHQRDVLADDPHTPAIEPSVPYSLAVMVENRGYGTARNFHIISAQPKIVENDKGLLIDFKIIGSEVAGEPVTPSLTVNFGEIPPGAIKIGRWLLTSTLQGLFNDYEATFEHVDPLGNPRLSLIENVEIHEMIRLVRAEGAFDDGEPDFLVNDVIDFDDLPDTLHLSDGRVAPVSVVESASDDGPPTVGDGEVQLTADVAPGWTYLRVPDPGDGQFLLVGVRRANGTELLPENFWTTDRTFIGLGQRPIRENVLHLFDYHTNGAPASYTLVYVPPSAAPDTNPPISAVFSLPDRSPAIFGVVWTGADFVGESGLDYFDIFVSDNGGPFTAWLARTMENGALYNGQPGHRYAFYSVATDQAGNREEPPATPDAATLVNLSNTPPTLVFVTSVTVDEGDTVLALPTAGDSDDPPQTLSFSLRPGAPAGVVVDADNGRLRWVTGEGNGPSTNVIEVRVTDNGFPPLSATSVVTVVVNEVNSPPLLAAPGNFTINEGALLTVTNAATDIDLPSNELTFGFADSAPPGAVLDPVSGVFQWRPTETQGPSTNVISVEVTDDGLPSLSATQQFTVIVRDVLSDFAVSVGSTNVLGGESNTVPVLLRSGIDLTNITLVLETPQNRLTNLTLQSASSEIVSLLILPAGSNRSEIQLKLDADQRQSGTRPLAMLGFLAVSNGASAIVPLDLSQLLGVRANGQLLTNGAMFHGRVIVVENEPVLTVQTHPVRSLTFYGKPGASYDVEFTGDLASSNWTHLARVPLTRRSHEIGGLNAEPNAVFYRVSEWIANPPLLEGSLDSAGGGSLLLYGMPGLQYDLQRATTLNGAGNWQSVLNFTLTNSFRFLDGLNVTNSQNFYRLMQR